jgi:hypothetical protein
VGPHAGDVCGQYWPCAWQSWQTGPFASLIPIEHAPLAHSAVELHEAPLVLLAMHVEALQRKPFLQSTSCKQLVLQLETLAHV